MALTDEEYNEVLVQELKEKLIDLEEQLNSCVNDVEAELKQEEIDITQAHILRLEG